MATDREQNIYDMFDATLVFNTENSGDYSGIALAATSFTNVQNAVNNLDAFFADQTSGEAAQAVEQKAVLRAAIRRKLVQYAKTARAIALDKPGFDELFKVPDSNNDNLLLATGRQIVEEATANDAFFKPLGIELTLAAALTADLDDLEAAEAAKAEGQQDTVGATAGIDNEIEIGMKNEKILDAIMNNVYRDNPVKLAAWRTARHVKRANQPPPPTP